MSEKTVSQPPEQGQSQPPQSRSTDVMLTEIAKIQSDGEYLKRDLSETRSDIKDLRDRMARLEVRVDHLPTKGFIITIVTVSMTVLVGIVTLIPKIQALLAAAK